MFNEMSVLRQICCLFRSLQVLSQIVDFSCKIGEYRELTEKYVKIIRFSFFYEIPNGNSRLQLSS